MWNYLQFFIEDAHLIAGSVRDDQLGNMGEWPLIQLLHHPLRNVGGGVAIRKRHAPQDKRLASPVRVDVV